MFNLVSNLGLIIGDLVPNKNKHWRLYLLLKQILIIAMADAITTDIIGKFDLLVTQYLNLYVRLFKCTLKFKHHKLTHYSRIMRKFGPLKFMSSIRFEAKHKEIKEASKVTTSRQNPSKTLAIKQQLKFCYRLVRNIGFSNDTFFGPSKLKVKESVDFMSFQNFLSPETFSNECYNWIRTCGTHYECGDTLNISKNHLTASFVKIKYLILSDANEVSFIYQKLNETKNNHVSGYELLNSPEWGFISHKDLVDYRAYKVHMMSDNKNYVSSYCIDNLTFE